MSAPDPATDRNLLFGILAVQLDFITKDVLIAALHAWVLEKGKPLGQILAEQRRLTPERRQLLEALVQEHLQAHQEDPQQSLASLSSASSLRQALEQIADDDVQASLAQVSAARERSAEGTASYHSAAPGARYRILRPHAKGGLGEVFVAEDTELHREVALKEIRKDHAADRDCRGRFVLEAEITGRLEHPGIVPVYGLGQYDDGRPFYAMRFIRGDNLKQALQRFHQAEGPRRDPSERNVAFRELLGRFVDVCNAVAYAHSRGVLHRDLKPGNIMLGRYGETLVVDWGLAKPVASGDPVSPAQEPMLRPSSADSALAATCMGSAVGTPAFMSPEQAAGRLDLLGPASDIYSLGATLYAVLTGTAPFRGELGDVLGQVQRGAFPPPRQVKADVPAALAAICLKAMALQPDQRYQTALQLAEDVEHWLADEPVSAWPEPITVRLRRWGRQHKPLVSGTTAALLVGLLALGVGGYWYGQEQARRALEGQRTEQEVQQALTQALEERQKLQAQLAKPGGVFTLLNNPADWKGQLQAAQSSVQKARSLAQNAAGLLDGPLGQELREVEELLGSDEKDYQLALDLEKVRLDKATWVEGRFDEPGAVRAYGQVFDRAGLRGPERDGDGTALAEKIRRSPIREQLLAALDDWALSAWFSDRLDLVIRLLALARQSDPDPVRGQVRDVKLWQNRPALAQLAARLKHGPRGPGAGERSSKLSPQLYLLVGLLLSEGGAEGEEWLREGQAAYPADFWLNFDLGTLLGTKKRSPEATGFLRAAIGVRPHSSAAHASLGNALRDQKDLAGAIREYRQAIQLDPRNALAHNNLGAALRDQKDLDGAILMYRRAIQLDPRFVLAHHNLGLALYDTKDWENAIQVYRRAIALSPKDVKAHINLGVVLRAKGDLAGAIQEYRRAIALDPKDALAHYNLGLALKDRKDLEGAVKRFRKALELDPNFAQAHYNLGLALYDKKDWENAIQAYRRAIELDPKFALAHYNLGKILLYPKQDFDRAIPVLRRAVDLDPKLAQAHGTLGLALLAQGKFAAAQKATGDCLQLLPQRHPLRGTVQEQRRLCEQALQREQRAVALLQGQAQPTGPAEQLQLAQFCRQYKHYPAAARLYALTLAAQPELADDLAKDHRYQAACAAALAAGGQGQGLLSEKLTAADKAKLRRQALAWLRADLKRLTQIVAGYQAATGKGNQPPASPLEKLIGAAPKPSAADVLRVCDRLQRWQTDPDLASLRDDKNLAQLATEEQNDWRQLWADVRALDKQARGCFAERQLEGSLTVQRKEQAQEIKLQAGKTYAFDLESTAFDAFLRLEDDQGKKLAENDDLEPGVNQNSRIVFPATKDGTYRLVATAFQGQGTGAYVLRIREFAAPGDQQSKEKAPGTQK